MSRTGQHDHRATICSGGSIAAPARHNGRTVEPYQTSEVGAAQSRPRAIGKFLFAGAEKLYVRGVTYGGFRPNSAGDEFPEPRVVDRDFGRMAANNINAVRTYTAPPVWLLDLAAKHRLRVLVGIPWEHHVAFLDDGTRAHSIRARVRAALDGCAQHDAVLGFSIGNEIPAAIVRWYGPSRIEGFLRQLYEDAKEVDANSLITYVNFPSTEYLDLGFLDFLCFNVYLEHCDDYLAYVARLQNLASDRPLIMSEIGLDSLRHGDLAQASLVASQVRTAFASGCAGTFVFSWTDEWHRGGEEVQDWAFGLTDRERQEKAALGAIRAAYRITPFPRDYPWPRVSAVVCSHNGARTIARCIEGLKALDYPDYEVIVVDDGSTDATPEIAAQPGVRLLQTGQNVGLATARNLGMEAASGDLIAYIDDDAIPDRHWLQYLAYTATTTDCGAVGGPNLPPPHISTVAQCVANAPGGPTHVLLSDTDAEHVPGCNLAVWKTKLAAIGGFDPQFWTAGDDVDVCWRLQDRGWRIAFSPGALVWHHPRDSIRGFWRQQRGYGKAEALLERKWPEKYNAAGHRTWGGRIYSPVRLPPLPWNRGRIYHGTWGSAPFQSVYAPAPMMLDALPLMPDWFLLIVFVAALGLLGVAWRPMLLTIPIALTMLGTSFLHAAASAARASFPRRRGIRLLKLRGMTAWLVLIQPLARLDGRLRHGLTPWRWRVTDALAPPIPRTKTSWQERWQPPATYLRAIELAIRARAAHVRLGGEFERWDIEARGGVLGAVRLRMATEEHGRGRQLLRFRIWPVALRRVVLIVCICAVLGLAAAQASVGTALVFALMAALVLTRLIAEWSATTATVLGAIPRDVLERADTADPERSATEGAA